MVADEFRPGWGRMTTRHLRIVFAVIIGISGGASVAAGQPALVMPSVVPPPSVRPPLAKPGETGPSNAKADPPPMAFFVATGPADACGPGCRAWIAADGKIDLYAAQRLRRVMAKLGQRRLPLFLHSAGGSVLGAIELGRLIRSHNLEVGVSRTLPAECAHGSQDDKACETLKRSGRDLISELDSSRSTCNSACVYTLAGGVVRSVPPGVRLGVHAIGFDFRKTPVRGPALAAATRSANARIVDYLHDMGIPKALFDAANAVPNESPRYLLRDELARFKLDTRAFGETDWRFNEKPNVAISKGFFARTAGTEPAYPEALLRLSCTAGKALRLTYVRERAPSTSGSRPVHITLNSMRIDLPYVSQTGKIEVRTTLWPDAVSSVGDAAAVEIFGFDGTGDGAKLQNVRSEALPSPDRIVLTMAGYSTAYAKLRKACDAQVSASRGCGAELSQRCMPEAAQNWRVPSPAAGEAAWPSP
jgi:hypothetical protein